MKPVVVVSGLPRSGTSLLMQCLEAGGLALLVDDARPPDDDNPRGYFEYDPVRASQRDASWLGEASGRGVKVVSAVRPALPAGPPMLVLLLRRAIEEVMASQARMLAGQGAGDGDPSLDAPLARAFEAQQERAAHWALARPETRLLEVSHRQLIEEPAAALAPVVDAVQELLGCSLDLEAMVACVDPRLWRQRRT